MKKKMMSHYWLSLHGSGMYAESWMMPPVVAAAALADVDVVSCRILQVLD